MPKVYEFNICRVLFYDYMAICFTLMSTSWSFDILFKLNAVETAEIKSKEAAAREFQADHRRIRKWVHQKEKMLALKK